MARRRRGMSQETLYHIDTPPAPPSAPQVSFQKFYQTLTGQMLQNQLSKHFQPTPVDPISESELPTNPGSTPKKTRYTNRRLSV